MQNSSHAVPNRWTKNCISEVKNIVIVGATHGNELHGIYIVNETNSPEKKNTIATDFPTLSVSGMIGNIAAVAAIGTGAGRRYCDVDLNRCFILADLANMDSCTVEELRAKELNALLGPKSSDTPKTDLILDIHSTTSNTGILLLCHPQDLFALQLVTHLQQKHPEISVSLWPDSEVPFLPSVARSGITVEIGPIAHSTTNSALYQETKIILNEALQYTNAHNENIVQIPRADRTLFQKSVKLQTFTRFASIGFPRDNTGMIAALIHPRLHGTPELSRGTAIAPGDPIFQVMSNGDDILYKIDANGSLLQQDSDPQFNIIYSIINSKESVYPLFINEAAYNEKDIAFLLMHKKEIDIAIFQLDE